MKLLETTGSGLQSKSAVRGLGTRSPLTAGLALLIAASSVYAGDYQSTVLSDGPRAYYRFNDTSQHINVNKNSGSLGPAGNATNVNVHPVAGAIAGTRNPAAYFDTQATSIIPFNSALNPPASNSFTVEAWFYPSSDIINPGPAPIMNRYSGSVANRQGWVFFQRAPNDAYSGQTGYEGVGWNFRMYTGVGSDSGVDVTSGVPYVPGRWTHVVVAWDGEGQSATMYIDGASVATNSYAGADPQGYTPNTDDHGAEAVYGPAGVGFGCYNNTQPGFNDPYRGAIDEFAFYSRKLTDQQILAHYQNGTNASRSTPYETLVQSDSPVAYLRFDDPSPDQDIAVNMGTLQNAGVATNTSVVRHPVSGALAGSTDGAYSYHWRNNGGTTTDIPFQPAMNPDATVPFTIEAWFRPTNDRQNPGPSPINNRLAGAAQNRTGWVFYQRAPNDTYSTVSGYSGVGWTFRMYTGSGSGSQDVRSDLPYTVGDWQHVVVTWDGTSTQTMYVNGAAASTNSSAVYAANTNPPAPPDDALAPADFAVGSYNKASGLGEEFEGDIDEVAFYTNILSADQILAHYQAGTNSHPATNYATLVLTALYDGAGTPGLQPVTYLRFSEPAFNSAANSGTLGDAAPASLLAPSNQAAGPQSPGYAGFESSNLAVPLDGTLSWVSLDNPSGLNISGQITLEAWIKPGAVQSDPARIISHGPPTLSAYTVDDVATNGSVLSGSEVFLRIEGNGATYAVGSSDGTNFHEAKFAVPVGDLGGTNWIHLAGTYDGANWKLFRNGTEVASAADAVGSLPVSNGGWAVGATGNGWENYFAGAIDEPAIYDHALTPSVVQSHYAAALSGGGGQLTLAISLSGGKPLITWNSGTLQESDTVPGTFTDVSPAPTSPYTPPDATTTKFYRLKQ